MNTKTISKVKARKTPEKRELFSVNFLTHKGRVSDSRLKVLVVRELLALTLASNKGLGNILKAYRLKLGFDQLFPTARYDQWISRCVHNKVVPGELVDPKNRRERRSQFVDQARPEYQTPDTDTVEHITLRIYAAEVLKPQSKGKPKYQLLAIAYHLKQHWVHVAALDISQGYLERDLEKKRADHARMLTSTQWHKLALAIKSRAIAEGTSQDATLVIHAPQGCKLGNLLEAPGLRTVEDMPSIPAETVELTYRIKDSKRYPLVQQSFASILRKPSKEELLSDVEMTTLPTLTNLTHREKDTLIDTLWEMIKNLRGNDGGD